MPTYSSSRVALVGAGWMAHQVWIPMLTARTDVRVSAVVEPRKAHRTAALGKCLGSVSATLEDLNLSIADAAVVAVPNHLHTEVAAPLLRRGMDTFVEKPVCITSDEASILAEASKEGGGRLFAWSPARHRADVTALTSIIPDLGPLRYVELEWVRAAGVPSHADWYRDSARSGGGALYDLGWHMLDIGFALLGGPSINHVSGIVSADFVDCEHSAAVWHSGNSSSFEKAKGVEDSAYGFMKTSNDAGITLRCCWASHNAHDISRLVLHGAQGTASLETTFGFSPHRIRPKLVVRARGKEREIDLPKQEIGAEYRAQVDAFVTAIADPHQTSTALDQTRRILAAIEGIYETSGGILNA